MTLETFKFGMLLTIIPFSVIFLFITACWALMDMALREVSGLRRFFWTLAIVVLPLAGPIAYNYMVRRCTGFKKPSLNGLPGSFCEAVE